jgi:Dockerin type I domain
MIRLTFLCLIVLVFPMSLMAAEVITDSTAYAPFDIVSINGSGFQANETVTLQVTQNTGDPLEGESGNPWIVTADEFGNIQTNWKTTTTINIIDTLQLNSFGESSHQDDDAIFLLSIQKKLHQLQNGAGVSSPANWSNGNINSSNSCYSEASAVPYRYFIKGLTSTSQHYFTINMSWTKGGKHGFDYLTDYDFSETAGIGTAGGICGTSSTTPPLDCSSISGTFPFPDPTNTANYSGTIPPDFFPAGFSLDGPRNLSFYNVVVDSVSKYVFGGTASDRDLSFKVYFTVSSTASVGFFWGGHTAEGTADTWELGNGSGSISGAPIHMEAGILDGSGGTIGRSLQSGSICNPPDPAITCDSDSVCADSTYTCTAASEAYSYDWNITGGTIISGQGTETITYTVSATYPGTVTITLDVCNQSDGCTDYQCCTYDEITLPLGNCCVTPVASCPNDTTIYVCDLNTICLSGFFCSSGIASVIGGTLTGDQVCFTPVPGVNTITLICTNDCDDADTCSVNVTVNYNTAPQITCPQNAIVSCEASTDPSNTGYAIATDDYDPDLTISYTDTEVTGQCPQEKIISRRWVAIDNCGAADTCVQTITVTDDVDPVITCPSSLTIDCAASTDPANTGYATATDNCDPNPAITYADVQVENVITRTWTATDACGNSDDCVQTITLEDTTNPTITCPDDLTVQCIANVPQPDIGSVTVSDDCDPEPVVIHVGDLSDGQACPETITRTYKVTDASGNFATCTQTITIDDDTDPVISCPQSLTIDCATSTDPSITGYATATDNCDPDPVIAYVDVQTGDVITRTWTATDDCDNTDQCLQTITIEDSTDPVISCPNDVEVQCLADIPEPSIGQVTTTDDCDPDPIITFEGDVSDGNTCPEVITRTYRATDYSGNFVECTQIITIDDDIPPEISCPPDITLACTEPTDPSHTGTATATDNCDPEPDITYSDDEVNGTIIRTWTATDECENSADCVQTITIEENDTPVCIVPDDQEFFICDDTTFTFDVYATDYHEVTCIMSTGDGYFDGSTWTFTTSGDGVYSGTFVCTDECGAYCEETVFITVTYNTVPVCFVPADDEIFQCTGQEVCYPVYAEDAEDNLLGCEIISGPGELVNGEWCYTPEGTETANVTILCTDACGATCEESFTLEFTLVENWAVLLIDRTGSMWLEDLGGNSRFERAKAAALADVNKLLDEFDADYPGVFEIAVMSFNSLEGVLLEQDFTSNSSLLINAINNIADPEFNTPLAAAMCQGACYMPTLLGCNKHMITYTDGLENNSHVLDMCVLCDPCDTYIPSGWNYDCDPSSPSSCTDWQMCLVDVFTSNTINTTYYFGEPINPFGKSNPPEDMYFMKAVADLSSGEFYYISDLENAPYECGDANTDFTVNVSDAVYIINYVFVGGEAPAPLYIADANCDDTVNVSDAVYVINYVFVGGPVPCYDCPIIVK